MTEPSPPRPVPGGARPVPGPWAGRPAVGAPAPGQSGEAPADVRAEQETDGGPQPAGAAAGAFAELAQRPVSEHVAVFEAEHQRLRDELSTIDRL